MNGLPIILQTGQTLTFRVEEHHVWLDLRAADGRVFPVARWLRCVVGAPVLVHSSLQWREDEGAVFRGWQEIDVVVPDP